MCAIVDANVAGEVFGKTTAAGKAFLGWLNNGRGQLVVSGKLLRELEQGSPSFRNWARIATLFGRMTMLNGNEVEARTRKIENEDMHSSNDSHVLAVAQLGQVRLLFTNDRHLEQDFKNKSLIDNPRGRVYHTRDIRAPNDNKGFNKGHQHLLSSNVCRS